MLAQTKQADIYFICFHLALLRFSNYLPIYIYFLYSQLVANTVLFTSVNLSGLFVRILTERAQRKAFLQARNCIEERLRMDDENEKQVNASVL